MIRSSLVPSVTLLPSITVKNILKGGGKMSLRVAIISSIRSSYSVDAPTCKIATHSTFWAHIDHSETHMIFVKNIYSTSVLGPKFYTKKCVNHDTAKFTMNQRKYFKMPLFLQSSTSRAHVKSINEHFHHLHCCMGKYLHNIYPYP